MAIDETKVARTDGGTRFEKPKTAPSGSESLKKISEALLDKKTLDQLGLL